MRYRIHIEVTRPGWSAPLIFILEGPEPSRQGFQWRLTEIRKARTEK